MRSYLSVLLVLICVCPLIERQVEAQGHDRELEVQQAASAFIEAFSNLDWEPFRDSFAADATVFFSFPDVPRRANGKEEIEALFKSFFDDVRSAAAGPPGLNIDPKDTKIQLLSNAAVVTFHLGERARRTVVFEKRDRGWVIVHLHASSTPQVQ